MNLEHIVVTDQAGVRTIMLHRPDSLNSLNYDVLDELEVVLRDCQYNEQVRVVVLKGAGRAFCAGDDLKGMGTAKTPLPEDVPLQRAELGYTRFILTIRNLAKPVIAGVHGYALGAGCDLALSCDLIIAAEGTKFGFVFAKRGLLGGTVLLPQLVGYHRSCEILFSGEMFTAEEAKVMGIVNRVVQAEDLDRVVTEWAERLAKGATGQLGMMKKALNQSLGQSLERAVDYQRYTTALMYVTHDHEEGKKAFAEKREPRFIGK